MWLNVEIVITQKCFQLGYYATVSVTHAAPSCKGPGPTTQPFGCDVRVSSQQVHWQLVKLVMWRDRRWSSKQSDNCSVVASSHGGHTPARHRSCQVTSLLLLCPDPRRHTSCGQARADQHHVTVTTLT